MSNILIVEDDAAFCQMLQRFLAKRGYTVDTCFKATDAIKKIQATTYDTILTDLRLPDGNGIELLRDFRSLGSNVPIILMTGYAEVGTAVKAIKQGAFDYISKPFTPEEILMVIKSALKARPPKKIREVSLASGSSKGRDEDGEKEVDQNILKGVSEASKKLEDYIRLVAPTDMSVLVTGDSGTGKEVAAKAIHNQSKRRDFRFVAVDCGAIPKELAASEFFGHLKGSFTGAIENKTGNFEAANGGTLFLDEVGNLSYENQIQLLRALQERKIKRVGSTQEIRVDVRIISATNEDLLLAVQNGDFREDLYHRLNEFSIQIPSLEERFEDLVLFAEHFLHMANENLNKRVQGFSEAVWNAFRQYHWPGN
ncbi:MAG: sigma-54 dependent transcriptional regulator, partial [Bacteroidota bacterium]